MSLIIHGTTLATNALIERKGAKTALLTTEGFRDVIEIRHENRFEQYDVNIDLPPPLVPRRLRLPIRERTDAGGRVLTPLDGGSVERAIDTLEKQDVEAVAVGFLHSFTNTEHERRVGEAIAKRLPKVTVTLSSEVSPEMREYERFSTACANAYVQPLMGRYLTKLDNELKRAGFRCPLFLMTSGGGVTTVETAIRFPVRLVESGPAGGAIFASRIAKQGGLDQVLSFDMGGTTAKICLIDHAQPQTSRAFEVARIYRFLKGSGLPLRIPVIEMVEIGAGGGSIARLDALGRIAVGPDSAGSEPGPVCYGRGGTEPTVTDADVVLGRIDPSTFSGGDMSLDVEGSRRAVGERIGEPPRSRRRARRARHQRDGGREHGERGSRARDRERQGRARAHPHRLRRRGTAPRGAGRREARHGPRAGPGECRRGLRGGLPPGAGRLRDRAQPCGARRQSRCSRRQPPAGGDARRGGGDRAPGRAGGGARPSSAPPSCAIAARAMRSR